MALSSIKITDFRCLASVQAEFDPVANLVVGPNAAGKTSLLEAIAYLGRGKSFRGAPLEKLIRHGEKAFVLFGVVEAGGQKRRLGVRNSREGLEISVDGDASAGTAALAESLPLQVIDPDVHNLIAGGPDERRKYLDWLGFHVEHQYLDCWRKYRRALRQRNAILKSAPRPNELDVWDRELAVSGESLDAIRLEIFQILEPVLGEIASGLIETEIGAEYRRGWKESQALAEALKESRERDVASGSTQTGPHRADILLRYDERQARKLVSRGQQKLLACALILSGVEVVQEVLGQPLLLLLDDPAAELDGDSLSRLMVGIRQLGCQVIATTLSRDDRIFDAIFDNPSRVFHVEHGVLETG